MGVTSKCHFVLRVPKLPKLKLLKIWKAITSFVNLWLRWGLKQNYNPCQELSNNMWHASYTHVFQDNYQLLMVGNQIGTSTLDPFFGHNLCFKYSNGSWKPILNIYVSRTFQWYKNFLIQWILTPEIPFWRFRTPKGFQLPKWKSTWECVDSFLHIPSSANVSPKLCFQLAPFHAFALIVSPRLRSWHLKLPKASFNPLFSLLV
jgi:hypothetical protein